MDPRRRRKLRLAVMLSVALLLAAALVYTTFAAGSAAMKPSQLATSAIRGRSYQLSGTVVPGSVRRTGGRLAFRVRDRDGQASVRVLYTGAVPEPFREGREVIVTVRPLGAAFVGEPDTLITKCPSKFTADRRS